MKSSSIKTNRRGFFGATAAGLGGLAVGADLGGWTALAASAKANPAWAALEKALQPLEEAVEKFQWVPRTDGHWLNLMARLARAKNILEIGTSVGFATAWLSAAAEQTGGKITTLEILHERVEAAKKNLETLGLAKRVTFKEGNAHVIVPTLKGQFDLVLLDADKAGHLDYFKKLHPKMLTRDAVVISNNAVKPRPGMEEYLLFVSKHEDFDSVVLTTTGEDGYCISRRKG